MIIEALNSCEESFRLLIVGELVDSGMSEELSVCVADNIDWTQYWLAFLESDGELENSPEGTAVIIEALSHCGDTFMTYAFADSGLSEEVAACVADNVDWTQFWDGFYQSNESLASGLIAAAVEKCNI